MAFVVEPVKLKRLYQFNSFFQTGKNNILDVQYSGFLPNDKSIKKSHSDVH
jgi:hypothetical protein